jgi:L-cystine uptake protein TcyP (sodium:dicarboxylate symporter family)
MALILMLFIASLFLSHWVFTKYQKLSYSVFLAMVLGLGLGSLLQNLQTTEGVRQTLAWTNIVGTTYVKLLKMIMMPLVFVSILGAISRMKKIQGLGVISISILGTLLLTTAISALIAIAVTLWFGLDASGLLSQERVISQGQDLLSEAGKIQGKNFYDLIISFIPNNPFYDLTGSQATSIINVVIFSCFLGIAALKLNQDSPELGSRLIQGIEVIQGWTLWLVRLVMRLTPYGVCALMLKMAATSSWYDIQTLFNFLAASYISLLLVFLVHMILLLAVKISPLTYLKDTLPVLMFAFTSRSSAASLPLNIECQINKLNNHPSIANFSASFGATIGQNGCAGVYPAMLAIMLAPVVGVPVTFGFIVSLVGIVTLSSLGVSGVGGGATFAAIMVLSTLGFPIELAGILIAIEPIIDMGRTALNVNGSIIAGSITQKFFGKSLN